MQRINSGVSHGVDTGQSVSLWCPRASGIKRFAYPDAGCATGADIEFANVEVGTDALVGERRTAAAIDYALDVACVRSASEAA